jgi:hypothetical protein
MSRSKHRSKCHHSCKMCDYIRRAKAEHKTSRQVPIEHSPADEIHPAEHRLIEHDYEEWKRREMVTG